MTKFLPESDSHYGVLPGLTNEELERHDAMKEAEASRATNPEGELNTTRDRLEEVRSHNAHIHREAMERNTSELQKRLEETRRRIEAARNIPSYPGNDYY